MMRELVDRLRYRFALHPQDQRAQRCGADGAQPPRVDRRWRLLLFLILLLNVTPWALWLVAVLSDAMALIMPALFWITIPGLIVGRPLFKPGYASPEPVGTAGWCIAILFCTIIATVLWVLIRIGLSSTKHHP